MFVDFVCVTVFSSVRSLEEIHVQMDKVTPSFGQELGAGSWQYKQHGFIFFSPLNLSRGTTKKSFASVSWGTRLQWLMLFSAREVSKLALQC